MFSNRIALEIAAAANAAGIPPTGMLALVEVETAGNPFEADGHTPNFLFERHIFYRELHTRQPEKLRSAIDAGLAIPKWSRATQYRDERNSVSRMALLARAKSIDEDCALRSCSWGLPQILGNECSEVGFGTAAELVAYMAERGVPGHVEVMIRFLKSRRLVSAIERKDWAYVALHYNGAGYRANQYDTRLASADVKWQRLLPTLADSPTIVIDPPEHDLSHDEIEQIQIRLRELSYPETGYPDGRWGTRTTGAISAFQSHEGLPVSGHYDAATRAALVVASPRPVPDERAEATVDEIRHDGSHIVATADSATAVAKIKVVGGSAIAIGSIAEQATTWITDTQTAVDRANQVKGLWGSIHDLVHPFLGHPMVVVLGLALVITGGLVWHYAGQIIVARLNDHRSGVHAGRDS